MSKSIKTNNMILVILFSFANFVIPVTILNSAVADEKAVELIKEVKLEALSQDLAKVGRAVFVAKCSACHKREERYVGPALKDVTKRRKPEWIMNMILHPAEMIQTDETAIELFGTYLVPMTFQNVSQDEARQILEFFRYADEKGEADITPPQKVDPDKKKADGGKKKTGDAKKKK